MVFPLETTISHIVVNGVLHPRLYFLFVFVFPKMEAPNFESIFECMSDGVNKVLVLVLVLALALLI